MGLLKRLTNEDASILKEHDTQANRKKAREKWRTKKAKGKRKGQRRKANENGKCEVGERKTRGNWQKR